MSLRKLVEQLGKLTRPPTWATILAPHKPVEALAASDEPIEIRAWWNDETEVWEAIEGSHRLAAAAQTYSPITIIPMQLGDAIPNRNLDGSDVIGVDPGMQAVTVGDALRIFRDWGKRPVYQLRVYV